MLPILEHLAQGTPNWLKTISPSDMKVGPGPWMSHLVKDALVYPGAGLDGSPVRQCSGVIRSFIFLDYGTPKADVVTELTRQRKTGTGFANHRLVDLVEFDPSPLVAHAPSEFVHGGRHQQQSAPPYGLWAVYETANSRPLERFSFMFMSTEAIQAMAALFPSKAPRGLVVQEHGFGGNCWPSFSEPILRLAGRWKGLPEVLILGPNHGLGIWGAMGRALGTDEAIESMHQNERELMWMDQGAQQAWLEESQRHA